MHRTPKQRGAPGGERVRGAGSGPQPGRGGGDQAAEGLNVQKAVTKPEKKKLLNSDAGRQFERQHRNI